jgi:ABC-type polysaccharide/polyol phosphate export permease
MGLWNGQLSRRQAPRSKPVTIVPMNSLWLRIRPLLSTFVRYMRISYLEAKSEYEGTLIGIFWLPLSTLLFAGLLGLLFHHSATMTVGQFFLYVLAGSIAWNLISDSISGSVNVIQSRLDFAIHNGLSLAGLFAKLLCDRAFEAGLDLALLIVAVLILTPTALGVHTLLIVPFIVMIGATSLAVSYLVNVITLLVPDLRNLIRTAIRFLFFATPIFWTAAERNPTDIRYVLETINPVAYFLRMLRQVVAVEPLAWETWAISLGITLVTSVIGLVVYRRTSSMVRNLK